MEKSTLFDTLIVVKRSGQRTSFQGEKIALAIEKAFRSIDIPYVDEDVNKVYSKVLKRIEKNYQGRKTINIENIQDLIEEVLKKEKFDDVYNAFSTYREHRNASRSVFVMKQQHKFLKAMERLGLNSLEGNVATSKRDLIDQFGKTISLEFAKAYLLDTKTTRYHDSGMIYIHSMETIPLGCIETIDIDFLDFLKQNNSVSTLFQMEDNINSFLKRLKNYLYHISNEVSQSISFTHFDEALEEILLKEYKRTLKEYFELYFDVSELSNFISIEKVEKELEKARDFTIQPTSFQIKEQSALYVSFSKLIEKATKKTEENLKQALFLFFQDMPYKLSINFGLSTTSLGRCINKIILETIENRKNIHYFFQLKKSVNKKEKDRNYDLYTLALGKAILHSNLYFINLDSNFNHYKEEAVSYGFYGRRSIEDNTTIEKKLVGGKGCLATVSIDIVRIALKHRILGEKKDLRGFYQELEKVLQVAKDVLLERFEIEVSKSVTAFPYLYQMGTWHDGEKLKKQDRLRKILKHGTLTVHFCGLKEAVFALSKESKSEEAYTLAKNILSFMKKKLDQYSDENNLNFVLSSVKDCTIERQFKKQDTAIFGKIKGVTDKEKYTAGYFLPIKQEQLAKLQQYILGGSTLTLKITNKKELEKKIEELEKDNFGCLHVKND